MKLTKYCLYGAILASVVSLYSNHVAAQVTVDNTLTIEQLVNDVLLGDGVAATNITFNGQPASTVSVQAGFFNAENSNIPLPEGVILSAGNSTFAVGPNNTGSGSDNVGFTSIDQDSDLEAVVGNNVFNVASLEFEFTVNADSIKFDFVFASEEYNEYVCATVNDVFGFFLSGPGINGPYSNNSINIALLPNTDVPISINTVNNGNVGNNGQASNCNDLDPNWQSNSVYFIDNESNTDPTSTQYDGFTVRLTAKAAVLCGETYRIKLAVADVSDGAWDSAVFIEAGSFSAAGEVFVNVEPGIPGINVEGTQYEGVVVAGCFSTIVELVRPQNAPTGEINVSYGGTAILGVDYILGENDTLFTFPPGTDTLFYNIQTLVNPNAADTTFLEIYVIYEICGGTDTVVAVIPIIPPYSITMETPPVVVTCPADSVLISAQGVNGLEPYFYDWGEFGFGGSVFVPMPPDEAYFQVSMTDPCDFEIITDSVLVTNNIPPPLTLAIPQPAVPTCPGDDVLIQAIVQNGNPGYTYVWNPVSASEPTTTVNFTLTQMVYLDVIDICGTTVQDSVLAIYPVYTEVAASFDSVFVNCPGDPITLSANSGGGAGLYTYEWFSGSAGNSQLISTEPVVTLTPGFGNINFTLVVTDQCGETGEDSQFYSFFYFPVDSVEVVDRPNCAGTEVEWRVIETYGGEAPFEYYWSGPGTLLEADTLTGTAVFGEPENSDYTLVVRDRCNFYSTPLNTFDYEPDIVFLDKMPNVITPNGDGLNDVLVIEGIQKFPGSELEVFDRWGRSVYQSGDYRAGDPLVVSQDAFRGEDLSDGTYFYVLKIDGGDCVRTGYIQLQGSNGTGQR